MKKVNLIDAVTKRWSPVAFSDRMVPEEMVQSLFEAARWAPSAFNEQPWRFIWATKEDPDSYNKLLNTLVPGNLEWAQHAPVLVLSLARSTFTYNSKPNPTALYDTGMAVGNLLAQATHLGLVVHQMSGFSKEDARKNLGIPDDYGPIAMMAIGYQGDPESLPEPLKDRERKPRIRKPIEEFVFKGNFWKT